MSDSLLDSLWLHMASMFPHTWTSGQGDSPSGAAGKTWATALSGLNGMQLAFGLHETLMLASDFPPSAGKFRALCFGIPTLAVVKTLMKKREASAFVALIYQNLDTYVFARLDQRASDRMLQDVYDAAVDYVMRGGELPDMDAKRIEPPIARERKTVSEKVSATHMTEIQRILRTEDQLA